ncbi:hypothetical protein [Maridesulfovibrio sp.]|uniref:hypothetical protein n=1 Tax=Maridesulfovibrio sp. TaxID=2795000 RepID=UPI0029CA50E8|nr:hypothetical protein [Maridesulfovibrio sp.]
MSIYEIAVALLVAWPLLAAIAAATPTPKDDQFLIVLRKVLDAIVFNWGHAKNALPENKEGK